MPYFVVKNERQETEHREISGDLVVGRAADCEISVRDILLSRKHCKIQRSPQGWLVVDLGSKNGTIINNERLEQPKVLHENDVVRVGRSKLVFHEGALDPELASRPKPPRPVDPSESLSGTLSGFTLLMPGEGETPNPQMPSPQPRPKDPAAYGREDVESFLSAIASSSWDSIYAEAKASTPAQGKVSGEEAPPKRRARPRSPIDLSLQVSQPSPVRSLRSREEKPRVPVPSVIEEMPDIPEPVSEPMPVAASQQESPPSPPMAAAAPAIKERAPVAARPPVEAKSPIVARAPVVAQKPVAALSPVAPPPVLEDRPIADPVAAPIPTAAPVLVPQPIAESIFTSAAAEAVSPPSDDFELEPAGFPVPEPISLPPALTRATKEPAPDVVEVKAPAVIIARSSRWRLLSRRCIDLPLGPARILSYVATAACLLAALLLLSDWTSPTNGSTQNVNPAPTLTNPEPAPAKQSLKISPAIAAPVARSAAPSDSATPVADVQPAVRPADPISRLKGNLAHPDPQALRAVLNDTLIRAPIFFW